MSNSSGSVTITPEGKAEIVALDAVDNPVLRQGIDYWNALRGSRPYPARADIKPRDLTPLLRNVVVIRLLDGGADYEYRIVGDAHVYAHGFSMQGKRLSEMERFAPGYGPVLKSLYDRAVRRRDGYALRGWLERHGESQQNIYSESAFLPMGPDDATIDHVLNFSVYSPRDGHEF